MLATFSCTIRDQTMAEILALGSLVLKGYPYKMHSTHQPFGRNQITAFLVKDFFFSPVECSGKHKDCLMDYPLHVQRESPMVLKAIEDWQDLHGFKGTFWPLNLSPTEAL